MTSGSRAVTASCVLLAGAIGWWIAGDAVEHYHARQAWIALIVAVSLITLAGVSCGTEGG